MVISGIKAMIHVVVDQRLLGVTKGAFHRLQLLSDIQTRPPLLDHGNDRAQMPVGALQPGYDLGVTCMSVELCHMYCLTSPGGWRKTPNKGTSSLSYLRM